MSNKFSTIKERVLQIAEHKGLSKKPFVESLGMTYGNFTGKAKETPLNSEAISNLLLIHSDVNPDWLLTGQGEMLRPKPTVGNDPSLLEGQQGGQNAFTGMSDKEIEDMLTNMFRDRLLEMYETGRAAPAVEVRRYQARIEDLSAQVARLELQVNELRLRLASEDRKKITKQPEIHDDTK